MTISDSHPLGALLERELEEEIYKAIDKLSRTNVVAYSIKVVLKENHTKKFLKS